jgi:cytochrome oxidase Cu insertion factor (SCO1/SenC/PrrC family)
MISERAKYLLAVTAGAAAAIAMVVGVMTFHAGHASIPSSAATALANPDVGTGTSIGEIPAPDFTLTDQDGRPTSLSGFRGKVVVLAFVDSHCTTICPLMTESMLQALRLLGPAASQVQLIGIDANPLATKVADVAAYTRAHHMQGRWWFLTGPLPDLKSVWRSYHVYVAAVDNDIDHQPIIILIDGRGRERTIYATQMSYEGVVQQAELLAEGISKLLPEHPRIESRVSLRYIPPIEPSAVVRLTGIGVHAAAVVLGKGHPHLLLFFAGWLAEDSDLQKGVAALDDYATQARLAGWPAPVAIDELPTEGSDSTARQAVADLAATLRTPVVDDERGRLGDGYGVQDLPWFALTSASGRILWHYDGWLSAQALDQRVRATLAAR